jgi:hypothetical protein
MEAIRDATVRSLTLGKMLKQRSLPAPKRVRELVPPDISSDFAQFDDERSQVEDMGPRIRDPQIWAWLLRDGKHLMSMSKVGILKVWHMWKEKVIASVDVMGNPLCWDYMMDAKGLTIIVNVETRDRLVLPQTRSYLISMLWLIILTVNRRHSECGDTTGWIPNRNSSSKKSWVAI